MAAVAAASAMARVAVTVAPAATARGMAGFAATRRLGVISRACGVAARASSSLSGAGSGSSTGSGAGLSSNEVKKVTENRDHPYLTQNARYLPGFSFPAPRKLEQIIKYALLERESPSRIREIWTKFHESRMDCAASVLTRAEYESIMSRAAKFPYFIYPVRRGDGKFFTLVSQFQPPYCIFTFLDDYKKDPNAAEPYFAVTFFPDFLERKGLVLVRGDFSGHINKADAERLLRLTKHYYGVDPRTVQTFNERPDEFSIESYFASCP